LTPCQYSRKAVVIFAIAFFRFAGQYQDSEAGLYYNRFRYYDPSTGNYLSQDPSGLAGSNPTLYGYVKDVNSRIDISGLDPEP
jgi:RHS repeat-associated protein